MLICLKNWNSSGMISPLIEQEIQVCADSNLPVEERSKGENSEDETDHDALQDLMYIASFED